MSDQKPDAPGGTLVYDFEWRGGRLHLCEAIYAGRKGCWRFFRDPGRGGEWKERGWRWHASGEAALRDFIEARQDTSERRTIRAIFGGSAEEDFRQMVAACHLLWELWRRVGEPVRTKAPEEGIPR